MNRICKIGNICKIIIFFDREIFVYELEIVQHVIYQENSQNTVLNSHTYNGLLYWKSQNINLFRYFSMKFHENALCKSNFIFSWTLCFSLQLNKILIAIPHLVRFGRPFSCNNFLTPDIIGGALNQSYLWYTFLSLNRVVKSLYSTEDKTKYKKKIISDVASYSDI